MYDRHAALVPAIARRVKAQCPATVEIEDLEQTGRAALWAECVAFDPAREATFRIYAKTRIRGAMLDWIRTEYREATRERDAVRIDDPEANFYLNRQDQPADPLVARAVARLGGRKAAVMCLRFYTGLSRPETAARIGISAAAAARAERSAIETLRGLLRAA